MKLNIIKKKAKHCHWGKKLAFKHEGIMFYGAGVLQGYNPANQHAFHICMLEGQELELLGLSNFTAWMLPTRDFTAPQLDVIGWTALIAAINDYAKGTEDPEIVVFCAGGHGRTGSMLAALYSFTADSKDPIQAIQDSYCIYALESKEQVTWVGQVTGTDVSEHLAKDWYN